MIVVFKPVRRQREALCISRVTDCGVYACEVSEDRTVNI